MGTNFYWQVGVVQWQVVRLPTGEVIGFGLERMDPRIHIGKRSAAGLYCWDCDITFCIDGPSRVHRGHKVQCRPDETTTDWLKRDRSESWYESCPKCGGKAVSEPLAGPGAVESGFAGQRISRPTGVRGCASFSWAQDPAVVRRICEERSDNVVIVDEYGRLLTGREFLQMLAANCPIEFTDSLGDWFS